MPFSMRPYRRSPKLVLAHFSCFWSLITFLVLSSGRPAYAEWVRLTYIYDNGMTVYVDPETIRRKGDLAKMWHLSDFKTIQTTKDGSFWSVRAHHQYDCAKERFRILAITAFSSRMGKGNVVLNISEEGNWQPFAPGSAVESLREFVCGKQ